MNEHHSNHGHRINQEKPGRPLSVDRVVITLKKPDFVVKNELSSASLRNWNVGIME